MPESSEAALLKFVFRLYHALEVWKLQTTEQHIKALTFNVIENSMPVDKKSQWLVVSDWSSLGICSNSLM
jgi:hypothetical protein